MQTTAIIQLGFLKKKTFRQATEGRRECGRLWCFLLDFARQGREFRYLVKKSDLEKATKGKFALHSQTIQQICGQYMENVFAAYEARKTNPKIRYPWKYKNFYPLEWTGQAAKYDAATRRLTLPMGRGRDPIVLKTDLPPELQGRPVRLVWRNGFELHISRKVAAVSSAATARATVDLGEIHLGACTTDAGDGLIVSGRGIRAVKRQLNKTLSTLSRMQSRCTRGSRRSRKLQRAKTRQRVRALRQIRDLRHKATRKIIDFCVSRGVGELFIGNPDGVRAKKAGRKHNQRMSGWEYGRDISYLTYKAKRAGVTVETGSERGTSSKCPVCGHRHKPKGREWRCKKCGFSGHRDLVGSVNMHALHWGKVVAFPAEQNTTYQRAGAVRVSVRHAKSAGQVPGRCSSPGTGQSSLAMAIAQSSRIVGGNQILASA